MAITMVCFTSVNAQKVTTFNMKMTVANYIEAMQAVNVNYGTTSHAGNAEALAGTSGMFNLAYANCPFSITFSGQNPAGQGVPRFARAEVGANASGFDVLSTFYELHIGVNGQSIPVSLYDTWGIAARTFPWTQSFTEAPHNGQISMYANAYVNDAAGEGKDGIPQRQTLINPSFGHQDSADAGDYTCTMTVTLAAL